MDNIFWLRVFESFIVGALWVTLITFIAERFGSKIGGFVGGLPSTIVIALLFIGLTQGGIAASRAATMIPFVMGVNGLFILAYLWVSPRGLVPGLGVAFLVWFLSNTVVVLSGMESLLFSLAGWVVLTGIAYWTAEHRLVIRSHGGVRVPYTLWQMSSRGLLSGAVIAFAVWVSHVAGPVVGGILTTFPVIFTSTLIITYFSGGAEFSRAVAKTLMLSGMLNVGTYAWVARWAFPRFSVWSATGICLLISLVSASVSYFLIRRRMR